MEKLRKNVDFIFTLLNKGMFTSHLIAFHSVLQYYTTQYDMNTWVKIKRRFHFHVATHLMCPWSFISLTLLYQLFFKANYDPCCRYLLLSWPNFYQLHVLLLTLCTHDIMIFGGMNDKLLQKICFLRNAKKTCKPNNCDLNRDWISSSAGKLQPNMSK